MKTIILVADSSQKATAQLSEQMEGPLKNREVVHVSSFYDRFESEKRAYKTLIVYYE